MMKDVQLIDDPKAYGPFDGVLMIFNIGHDNYEKIGITKEYEEKLIEAISSAHANGWATMYLFDNVRGVSMVPEVFEYTDDMDFCRLIEPVCGISAASFDLLPSMRKKQFEAMLDKLHTLDGFAFGNSASAMGLCLLGGEEVLLPFTSIR